MGLLAAQPIIITNWTDINNAIKYFTKAIEKKPEFSAAYFEIGWDLVKDIQKQHFKTKFDKPKLRKLNQIAIDEISISKKKQQRYLTIVYDLLSGRVVFVGDGKGADALDPFWRRVKRAKAKIQAVAIDMSPAYISAVHENLPKATLVFDHFHIVKLFNEKLSDLRRKLYHQLNEKEDKKLLKGTRWLLLKNPDNLNADRDEPKRLKEALELNEPLAAAYYLKEELRQLWSFATKQEAEVFFDGWLKRAWSFSFDIIVASIPGKIYQDCKAENHYFKIQLSFPASSQYHKTFS